MHFLGVAGMPRRIPGEQFVSTLKSNDYKKYFATPDNFNLRPYSRNFNDRFLDTCKFTRSKSKFFGQCTKIGYNLGYACLSAILCSGMYNGIVGR